MCLLLLLALLDPRLDRVFLIRPPKLQKRKRKLASLGSRQVASVLRRILLKRRLVLQRNMARQSGMHYSYQSSTLLRSVGSCLNWSQFLPKKKFCHFFGSGVAFLLLSFPLPLRGPNFPQGRKHKNVQFALGERKGGRKGSSSSFPPWTEISFCRCRVSLSPGVLTICVARICTV